MGLAEEPYKTILFIEGGLSSKVAERTDMSLVNNIIFEFKDVFEGAKTFQKAWVFL